MKLTDNTILITGGSEGIGLEMARALAPRNTVIICGRSKAKLDQAKTSLPGVVTMVCDVSVAVQREALVSEIVQAYPKFNLLINNAGGRQVADLLGGKGVEAALSADLGLNFTAPVSLCQELMNHLQAQPAAAIVNVTTGLVYLPKAAQPFYCAAKAALRSYTQSLRWALRDTDIGVFEVLMPLVDTSFHQGQLPTTVRAMSAETAAKQALQGVGSDKLDIHVGKSSLMSWLAFLMPRKGLAIVNKG
jgi:uncharacterized oxidoreductase